MESNSRNRRIQSREGAYSGSSGLLYSVRQFLSALVRDTEKKNHASVLVCALVNIAAVLAKANPIISFALLVLGNPRILSVVASLLLIHLREAADQHSVDVNVNTSEQQMSSAMRYGEDIVVGTSGKSKV